MSGALLWLSQPRFWLLIVIVDVVAAAFCLAALSVGESRQHWFWRGLGVSGLLALLLPIRAFEPLLLFLIVAPLLAVASAWQAGQQARLLQAASSAASRWRFGLSDLFQGLTLFGVGLGLWVAALQGEPFVLYWRSLPIAALVLAIFAWRAWQVAANPRQWQNWLKLAGGLLAIMIAESFLLRDWMYTSEIFGTTGIRGWTGFPRDVVMVPVLYIPFAGLLILGARLLRAMSSKKSANPARWRYAKVIACVLLLVAGVPMTWLYIRMLGPPLIPGPPVSQGDVYRQLHELGTRIRQATPTSAQQMHAQAEQLLQQPASVPLDFREATIAQDQEIRPFTDLRRALIAESSRQETLGKRDEAVKFALADVRLGTVLQRGGNALHALVGLQCELSAIFRLAEMREKLSPHHFRAIVAELERSETLRDPADEIADRARRWDDLALRWRYRLQAIVVEDWNDENAKDGIDLYPGRIRNAAYGHLLSTDLAIRAFQHDEGKLPKSLAELTPIYLPASLPDPYSREPLRYRPSGDTFLLYSVGPDLEDNGGQAPQPGQKTDSGGYDIEL
ncbi:MAG: hypothetical protein ACR2FY_22625 [Pirellulaceae bacterium]